MRSRTPRHNDWIPIRNWLWATLALAILPISGLVAPGPIATALMFPFVVSIVLLGTLAIVLGVFAIALGALR